MEVVKLIEKEKNLKEIIKKYLKNEEELEYEEVEMTERPAD